MPPWECVMALGMPVVPEEYKTHRGCAKGTGSNSSEPCCICITPCHNTAPSGQASSSRPGKGTTMTVYMEGMALDRKSVVSGKGVPERVDLGGCRNIKKQNIPDTN